MAVTPELVGFRWLTSPLARAVETAARLGVAAQPEPLFVEMDWGDWEGRTLADLRANSRTDMAAMERRGLDFRPPGGESPREVQLRLAPLLAAIAASGLSNAAITHKGVMRAVFALATGWDMLGKPPYRLDWAAAQLFRLDADGTPRIERLNLRLARG